MAPIKKDPVETSPLYQLKITLRGSDPAIWRRIQVPGIINLNRLHDVFQVVMGWTDSHLHAFVDGPTIYSMPMGETYSRVERLDERCFSLSDFAENKKARAFFINEYDFGDSWIHKVVIEKILPADPEKMYAVCLDGGNACPAEDCGGIRGYYGLLEILKDPEREGYEDALEWFEDKFDPSHFDRQIINADLRRFKNLTKPSPYSTH